MLFGYVEVKQMSSKLSNDEWSKEFGPTTLFLAQIEDYH
jgi:hypothetical protein